jgi:branched-chain amino acid transport system ATP-binding protein
VKLFEASGLSKRFGAQVVLQDITLSFEEGQLNGIMGPNGAGKTTCFNVLTGRYKPDRGRVTFAGEDITGLSPREIARKGVSRSFQIMNLFDSYTALDNVLVATPHVRNQGFNSLARPGRRQHGPAAGRCHPRTRGPQGQGTHAGQQPVLW